MTDGRSFWREYGYYCWQKAKRRQIALDCSDLVVNGLFKDLTIAKLAKEAGIAKGSFYDYFENKEDLIFEIVTILMENYNKKTKIKLQNALTCKDKLKEFAAFFYAEEDKDLRKIYNQFMAISLIDPTDKMVEFQAKSLHIYKEWLKEIIKEAINNGELKEIALSFADSLFATVKGYYLNAQTTNTNSELKNTINSYIDNIYKLIGTKWWKV